MRFAALLTPADVALADEQGEPKPDRPKGYKNSYVKREKRVPYAVNIHELTVRAVLRYCELSAENFAASKLYHREKKAAPLRHDYGVTLYATAIISLGVLRPACRVCLAKQ